MPNREPKERGSEEAGEEVDDEKADGASGDLDRDAYCGEDHHVAQKMNGVRMHEHRREDRKQRWLGGLESVSLD